MGRYLRGFLRFFREVELLYDAPKTEDRCIDFFFFFSSTYTSKS